MLRSRWFHTRMFRSWDLGSQHRAIGQQVCNLFCSNTMLLEPSSYALIKLSFVAAQISNSTQQSVLLLTSSFAQQASVASLDLCELITNPGKLITQHRRLSILAAHHNIFSSDKLADKFKRFSSAWQRLTWHETTHFYGSTYNWRQTRLRTGFVVFSGWIRFNFNVTVSNISCCGTLFNATFTVQDIWHKIHGLHEAARPSSPKLLHTIQWYNPRCQPEKRPHKRMEET